jgi:hypothetical protein
MWKAPKMAKLGQLRLLNNGQLNQWAPNSFAFEDEMMVRAAPNYLSPWQEPKV